MAYLISNKVQRIDNLQELHVFKLEQYFRAPDHWFVYGVFARDYVILLDVKTNVPRTSEKLHPSVPSIEHALYFCSLLYYLHYRETTFERWLYSFCRVASSTTWIVKRDYWKKYCQISVSVETVLRIVARQFSKSFLTFCAPPLIERTANLTSTQKWRAFCPRLDQCTKPVKMA